MTSLRRRPSAYRSSAPIVELDVTLANGATLTLLAKDLSRQALHRRAREVKPEFLHDPLREIDTYRLVLEAEGLGTPAYYGSVVDPTRDRYWLVIEKVRGIELYQVGELEVWCGVLRWLARLHERFAGCELPAHLLRYDRELLLGWRDRARAFADVEVPGYEEVVEDLLSRPATLLHGELYPSNVLVDDGRVCPVDWELAGAGPAVVDVAAITRGLERSGACRAHPRLPGRARGAARRERLRARPRQRPTPPRTPESRLVAELGAPARARAGLAGRDRARRGAAWVVSRSLIVNADDFGQSPGINSGVIRAYEEGILTSASLMVRWPAAQRRPRTHASTGS